MKSRNFIFIATFLFIFMFSIQALAYSSNDITAYYSFDTFEQNVSTKFLDSTGLYNLTLTNNVLTTSISGIQGNAVYTDSESATTTTFKDMNLSGKFTVNYWIKVPTYSTPKTFFLLTNNNFSLYNKHSAASDIEFSFNQTGSAFNANIQVIGGGGVGFITLNDWGMVTITYDGTVLQYYLNGNLWKNMTNKTGFRANTKTLTLGNTGVGGIDEFMVMNNSITQSEINVLLNYGLGLNYSQTIGGAGFIQSSDICLDTTYLCTNPVTLNNITYCAESDKILCQLGCYETYYGVGQCRTSTTTANLYNPNSYTITLESSNSKTVNNKITIYPLIVGSSSIIGYFGLQYPTQVNYLGVQCDYRESYLLNQILTTTFIPPIFSSFCNQTGISTPYGYGINLNRTDCVSTISANFTATSNDMRFSYDITPRSLDGLNLSHELLISLRSSNNQDIIPISYYYDSANTSLCIRYYGDLNSTLKEITCVPYDNTYATIEGYIKFSDKKYSLKIISNGYTYYTTPLNFFYNGLDINKIVINQIDDNSASTIGNFNITNTSSLPVIEYVSIPLNAVTLNYFLSKTCDYSVIGCYKTRFYSNTIGIQAFNSWQEWSLCSEKIGSGVVGLDSDGNETEVSMTSIQKFYWGSALLLIAMMIIGALLLFATAGQQNGGGIVGLGVLFTCFVGIVILGVFGWYPVWVVLLIGLLDAAFVVLMFKIIFLSSGGG